MQQHQLTQGSAEWLAHRATCWNASDAPAMMGVSPYKTRTQFIKEVATGLAAEVDAATQQRFDDGHRFEALARPHAETIVCDDLSPLSGSIDAGFSRPLAASFDGLTFMRDTNWEHKSLNDALRAVLPAHGIGDTTVGASLPLNNRVQLEQQMAVSGAERSLFTASKWEGDTLVEERHCWYASDPALRAQILAGWAQLEKDVAAYVPAEVVEPAKADAMDHLPAVSVRLDGALSVAGNLPMFADALKAFIARIPARPTTDNEFATCDAACKALKKAEEALDAAEAGALASITDVEAMRRAVAECRKLARDTRLASEKLVERRKAEVKEQAVLAARRALDDHVATLNAELAPMRLQPVAVDFAAAIKGLRSFDSMQDALDTALVNGKIAADGQARAIRVNVAAFKAAATGLEFLFSDLGQIIHKAADDFATLVTARVDKHKADEARRLELEREKIRAEEAARLEREAAQSAAAQKAIDDAKAEAERKEREAAEAKAKADAKSSAFESWARSNAHPTDDVESIRRKWEASPEYHELHGIEYTQVQTTQQATPEAAAAPAANPATARVCEESAPVSPPAAAPVQAAPVVRVIHPAAQALRGEPVQMIGLGELWELLGLADREAFLSSLGFPATPAPKGTGKLYRAADVDAIRRAIAERMTESADWLQTA